MLHTNSLYFQRLLVRFTHATGVIIAVSIIPVLIITKVYAAAPVISNVAATAILTSSATITWTTDLPADSQVEYGTTLNYGTSTTLNTASVTAHSQVLSGLQANTTYHFRVESHDNLGTLATSNDSMFVTALGYSAVGPLLDSGDTNVMNANRFVTNGGGKVVSLSAHVGSVGVAPNNQYQMALYTDSNGLPGTLLANTAAGSLTANAWNTLPLTTTPVLAANTAYFITYNTNGGNTGLNNLHYADVATTALKWKASAFGTWPASFGSITSQETMTQSVYASFVPVDPGPARVAIVSPTAGQVISSTDVTISYTKSGTIVAGDGQHAHLRLDGGPTKMDIDFDGTYVFTGVAAGQHSVEIIVADANHVEQAGSGQTVSFSTITPDAVPPTVSLIAPINGATVTNTIAMHATAADAESGISKVQFWLDGTRQIAETSTANPDYTANFDTTTITNGTHTLMARAIDVAFNQTDTPAITFTVQNADPRASLGEWGSVLPLPIVPVHASLLHTGEILMWDAWDSTSPPRLWNMATNTFTSVPVPQIGDFELFCAGQATTGTGELVVAGGHGTSSVGINTIYMFNPDTRTWTKKANMQDARWYPSVTQMSDNRMMIIGGQSTDHVFAQTPEIFDPQTNTIQALSGINTSAVNEIEYPQTTMLPTGKIMSISAENGPIMIYDPANISWTQVGTTQVKFGAWTSFAPGKYLITGGGVFNENQQGNPSEKIAKVLDMTSGSPVWTSVPDMSETRAFHNVTMLPNGKAMVIGGAHIVQDSARPSDAAYSSQIWDPATNTWAATATMSQPRMYHSVSMLLPDGRVLSAGGGRLSPAVDQLNAQIYSPDYLFRGARPTVTSAPTTARHNSTMDFVSPDAASITKVTLSSLGSVTHTADWNQHFMDLNFTRNGNTLTINTPSNSNVLPEGYYMIFLVNSDGVPAQAQIVRIASPDVTAPVISAVQATGIGSTVATINWNTNEGSSTQVDYGTTTAYGTSTALVSTSTTVHSQGLSGLLPNTLYHYSVKSRDAAGNLAVSGDNTFTTTAASNPDAGLVAAYNFNANTGTTLSDNSGNGNTGSVFQATWVTAGKFGSALNFDGTNDLVTVNDSNSLHLTTGATIEAWVKPTTIAGWRTAVMKEYPGNMSYGLYASDGNAPPAFYGNVTTDVSALGTTKLALNTWAHVSGTYDGANLKLYVNGALVKTKALTGTLRTSASPLRIGGNTSWVNEYFAGQIDEVRIYNRALTQAEIQANMNVPL